jgi:hypothetical protein
MGIEAVKLKRREISPHKTLVAPLLNSRNVLTNSPWTFVALWLQRNHKPKALFYWEQAQEFHKVSVGLPLRSAPLLLYYCFMNAVKALLVAKSVSFDERHGVSVYPRIMPGVKRTFAQEGVKIQAAGILPSLSAYYGEAETLRCKNYSSTWCSSTGPIVLLIPVRRKCSCHWQTAGTCTTL